MAVKVRLFALLLVVTLCATSAFAEKVDAWDRFSRTMVTPDGRTMDTARNNMSHSEGQGYAMLLAVEKGERALFDRLWRWTSDNLQIRKTDFLLAWSFSERMPGQWRVSDYNNATDGDVLVAWALLRGYDKWGTESYRTAARQIIRDMRITLSMQMGGYRFLLPAYYGFQEGAAVTLNPSYIIPVAYRAFALADDAAFWTALAADGDRLVQASSFGTLPADWVLMTPDGVKPHPARGTLFGYDAMRTVLYAAWGKRLGTIPGLRDFLARAERTGVIPASADMQKGVLSLNEAGAGGYAIFARAACDLNMMKACALFRQKAEERLVFDTDYYSTVLYLLSTVTGL